MKTSLFFFALSAVALGQLMASSENAAIVTVAESFLRANATITTKIDFDVEKVEADFARVKIIAPDTPTAAPAWIFLKKNDGKWRGLTVRAAFDPEHYQEFGIPKSLWIN